MASAPAGNSATTVQEYVIRVPKNSTKKYHVMRFNSVLNVDFSKWNQVKMERENNMKEYRGLDDEMPKFGAGSEFGRDQREEARRKKFGIVTKKYRPEDQPWILKVGGKTGKKFKGIREGGVGENAAYYVFTHAPDGAIDAFPLREWYNFQPIQRYKALSAEEAEQEFGRRNKVMNYFSLMLRKRLRNDEDGDVEDLEEGRRGPGGKGGKGRGELKISDMDEWVDSDGGEDNSDEEDGDKEKEGDDSKEEKKKKGKKAADKKGKAKKKRKDSDDEAFEESDDGDEEGREVDYISDSSDSELDQEENVKDSMKGVAEEDALRKLLTSDEDDDEEREGGEDEEGDEDKGDGEKGDDGDGEGRKGGGDSDGEDEKKGASSSKKKKAKGGKKDVAKKKDPSSILNDSSSNYSSDSSDSETKKKNSKGKETNSGNSSRAATPTKNSVADTPLSSASSSSSTAGGDGNKRKGDSDGLSGGSAKKPRIDGLLSAASSDSGITEEAVRRYLMRKPMTTTELLQKFKSKKTGLSSEQLVNVMTQILKRINPIKQFIKGKMYLSIKG